MNNPLYVWGSAKTGPQYPMKKYLITSLIPLLAACAGPKVTPLDAEIMQYQAAAVSACYQAETARRQAAGYVDARDQALVIMAEALASGGRDRCAGIAGINVYESRARIAEAQNKAAEGVTRSVVSGAVIGTGIVAGADVLKTALTNTGARTTTTIQGDGNTASHTSYDTRANTTNNMSTRGESSPVTANNPPVTGPDQSSTVEITEAAETVEAAGP